MFEQKEQMAFSGKLDLSGVGPPPLGRSALEPPYPRQGSDAPGESQQLPRQGETFRLAAGLLMAARPRVTPGSTVLQMRRIISL